MHDVARLMRVAYDRRARALGLTRSQWWVLNHLYFNEGITQSELADVLDVEKPTLGRLLDRLEAKGWVERRGRPQRPAGEAGLSDRRGPGADARAARDRRRAAPGCDGRPGRGRAPAGFVDTLLVIKANLLRINGNGNGSWRRTGCGPPRERR